MVGTISTSSLINSPSDAVRKGNKWDGVEPIPTKIGRDAFHGVRDQK